METNSAHSAPKTCLFFEPACLRSNVQAREILKSPVQMESFSAIDGQSKSIPLNLCFVPFV